ncbi:MAG: ATP-binding cassette domain-containing protein, partial [Ignavibacteriaceae bacterium]|nr:ATP-binding cassette domain-containing protein [Ignavibacteriaceae bacterium]
MVEINKLSKKYNKNEILKNISLSINKGEVTAVVGPNGSGKTTLIKSILGLVKLNSGSVEVDGINIKNNFTYKNNIGYVPQVARYPENLTGNEILSLVKELRTNYEFSSQKIIESFKLSEELNKP